MSKPYVVLLRQLGGLGDWLMATPAILGLREKYPDYDVHVITSDVYCKGALLTLAKHNPLIKKVHDIHPGDFTTANTLRHQPQFLGAKDILQHPVVVKSRGFFDINTACIDYENSYHSVAKTRTEIWCDACRVAPSSMFPIYKVKAGERAGARRFLKHAGIPKRATLVGVSPSSMDDSRSLTQGKFYELLRAMIEADLWPVVIGSKFPAVHERLTFVPDLPIEQSCALIAELTAFIGVDSGPIHIAGSMGVPVIGLFGPTDPAMRLRYYDGFGFDSRALVSCAHCWYKTPCTDPNQPRAAKYACLTRLPMDVVVEQTHRLIRGR